MRARSDRDHRRPRFAAAWRERLARSARATRSVVCDPRQPRRRVQSRPVLALWGAARFRACTTARGRERDGGAPWPPLAGRRRRSAHLPAAPLATLASRGRVRRPADPALSLSLRARPPAARGVRPRARRAYARRADLAAAWTDAQVPLRPPARPLCDRRLRAPGRHDARLAGPRDDV